MKLAIAAGVGILGCQPRAPMPHPEQCNPGVPADAEHPITVRTSSLAGDYQLIQVRTQPDAGTVASGRLHLEPLDSAARVGAVGGAVRDLVGWLKSQTGDPKRRAAAPSERSLPGVVLTGDHLVVRSPSTEEYVEHFTITAVAWGGFWGWWRAESAVREVPGEEKRILPAPAGYFCALRVPS